MPEIVYPSDDLVSIVTPHGSIPWAGCRIFIRRGLVGQPVAIRPTPDPAVWTVHFCQRQVALIDLRHPEEG